MALGTSVGRRALAVGASAVIVGCASTPAEHKVLLEFLDQPSVTAEQVRERLGEPHATFEQERVLAYRLNHKASGYYVTSPRTGWEGVRYDLIIVLDEHNVVQKHNLVAIRPP